MSNDQKITFKICYLYPGMDSKVIELKTTDKKGSVSFLDNSGNRVFRAPVPGEEPVKIVLSSTEKFKFQGDDQKRVYTTVSYYPESMEGNLEQYEITENIVNRRAHEVLKEHQHVVVRSSEGANINPNQNGIPMFELIEESKLILADVEKNNKVSEAMNIAKDMFQNHPEVFVDFCYSYNIMPIENVPIHVLYNEVIFKIQVDPSSFFSVINHKDATTLTLIKKALLKTTTEGNSLISIKDNFYYLDGEIVGQSEDEVIHFFNRYPKKKEFLMRSLGIAPDVNVEVVPLPPVSENAGLTDTQKEWKKKTDASRLQTMKMEVAKRFKRMQEDKLKNKSEASAIEAKFFEVMRTEIRDKYIDIVDAYDAYVADKKSSM
jgi:hypothetical protein